MADPSHGDEEHHQAGRSGEEGVGAVSLVDRCGGDRRQPQGSRPPHGRSKRQAANDAAKAAADRAELHGVPGTFAWTVEKPGAGSSAVERIRLGAGEATWSTPAWQAEARWAADSATAGRVVQAMDGKLLRVGRAAVQCETFDGQPLAVALAGIVRALELLPRPGASGREAAEYNRRSAIVHDFLLDWAAARWGLAGSVPSGLAALRTQFSERGRIPFRDEDPLPPGHWISWFLANGTRPRQADLTAMAMSEERLSEVFRGV